MRWLSVAVLVLAAGCGGAHSVVSRSVPAQDSRNCTGAMPAFRTCLVGRQQHPTIERLTAAGWAVVTGPLQPSDPAAGWGDLWLSPDSRTLLAEWLFPCDSAVAVFVPLDGGTPRVATGQLDWRKAPISRPLGWAADGKARVRVFGKRRVQLIDPHALRRVRVKPTSC